MSVRVLHGDCRRAMRLMARLGIRVDAVVTDPPYHLTSIVKRFGGTGAAPAKKGTDGRYKRLSGGFMNQKWDAPDAPPIDPEFAHWFAGFADGEGCFSVHKKTVNDCQTYDCQFSISLRRDDAGILKEIQRQLGGIGSFALRPAPKVGNGKPQARYCISSQRDCLRLREIFSVFPLRAKKAKDFEIWSVALDEWVAHKPGTSWQEVAYFRDALMAVRQYGAACHPSQLFHYQWARGAYSVLKPGGHLLAFGGTRGAHRMVCAIEDAGFEIRDTVAWLYGSGFPKSHDISKAIDKAAGAEREVVGVRPGHEDFVHRTDRHSAGARREGWDRPWKNDPEAVKRNHMATAPATPEAAQWDGWGTALKPAFEPIILARKPLSEKSVAANVLRHGTGAINVDGCRIEAAGRPAREVYPQREWVEYDGNSLAGRVDGSLQSSKAVGTTDEGRWPANVCHDGSAEVEAAFAAFGESYSSGGGGTKTGVGIPERRGLGYHYNGNTGFGDSGTASRFFYSAKAGPDDRFGSKHPTVKPVALMRWLVRLVTPPGGMVLDPFAGSGTTGIAALAEGCHAILIEREAEYVADIRARLDHYRGEGGHSAAVKARHRQPVAAGPLFGEAAE